MDSNLVTTEQLKNLTSIGLLVDCEILSPHINIAQNLYVYPILGKCLYEDLITNFDANTLSADYEILLNDYITPALGFSSWYSCSPFLHIRTNRNGLNKSGTDTVSPVELDEFSMYLSKVENMMRFYLKRLEDFLICNKTIYPLYRQNSAEVGSGGSIFTGFDVHPKRGRMWDASDVDSLLGGTGNCSGDCVDC